MFPISLSQQQEQEEGGGGGGGAVSPHCGYFCEASRVNFRLKLIGARKLWKSVGDGSATAAAASLLSGC